VKFPEFLNKGKKSPLPQVAKRLGYDSFFDTGKTREVIAVKRRQWLKIRKRARESGRAVHPKNQRLR
jgi:hypothetical protein